VFKFLHAYCAILSSLSDKQTFKYNELKQTTTEQIVYEQNMYMESLDMKDQAARLSTFADWPVQFLPPKQLAANGFYYLGRGDEVRCAFCKVEIMRWVEGDNPAIDHQRWAPQCPFVRNAVRVQNGNALSNEIAEAQDENTLQNTVGENLHVNALSNAIDERFQSENALQSVDVLPCHSAGRPAHPQYATEMARLATFKDWPRGLQQKPEDLAEAGYYYTGKSDKTKCFYCDGGLQDWEAHDVPWEQHARWFNNCEYVLLVKGRDYVQKITSEACVVKNKTDSEQCVTAISEINDDKICKICYNAEKTVCFVPCGHVVACGKCAVVFDLCPTCRANIKTAVRIYQV
jgi:baculoviral IAP repeat-containing protein 7/8